MLFSIITVCFNSANTIRQTIKSVLSQSCKDYEYIVVDGGSTDGTVEILQEYEAKFNGRMRWISEPDNGIYDAMNKGIQIAGGEFLNFMNSDDTFVSDAFENTREWILKHTDHDVYYGITRLVNSRGEERQLRRFHHTLLPKGYMICHQSIFTKNSLFYQQGVYRTDLKVASDYDFYLKAFGRQVSFEPMDVLVVNFCEDGFSGSNQQLIEDETRRIMVEQGYLKASSLKCTRLLIRIHHLCDASIFFIYHFLRFFFTPFLKFEKNK